MLKYLISLGLLLTSLSQATDDRVFEPHLSNFEKTFKRRVKSIIFLTDFKDKEAPVGVCYQNKRGRDEYPEIYIDRKYWENAKFYEREELLFHELGHCEMQLDHNPYKDSVNCPISIMYPHVFGDSFCYVFNRQKYFKQLKEMKKW